MPRGLSKNRPKQGAHLVELRKRAHLTQAELAELIGESQRNIAYWEQSDKPPRSDILRKLADVLTVRIEQLLVSEAVPAHKGGPVGKVRRLFEEVSQLSRQDQKTVVQFVTAFVNEHRRRTG